MAAAPSIDVTDPLAVFSSRRVSRLEAWQRKLLAWSLGELLGVPLERAELMAYTPFFELMKVMLSEAGEVQLADHELLREISRLRVIGEGGLKREPPLYPLDRERLRRGREACHQFADQYDPACKLLRGPSRVGVHRRVA